MQKQLNQHNVKLDNIMPRLGKTEGQIVAHTNRMDTMAKQLERHAKLISELQEKKVNIKDDKVNRRAFEKRMKAIDVSHGTLLNQ